MLKASVTNTYILSRPNNQWFMCLILKNVFWIQFFSKNVHQTIPSKAAILAFDIWATCKHIYETMMVSQIQLAHTMLINKYLGMYLLGDLEDFWILREAKIHRSSLHHKLLDRNCNVRYGKNGIKLCLWISCLVQATKHHRPVPFTKVKTTTDQGYLERLILIKLIAFRCVI